MDDKNTRRALDDAKAKLRRQEQAVETTKVWIELFERQLGQQTPKK